MRKMRNTEMNGAAARALHPQRFGRATEQLESRGIIGFEASRAILAVPIEWIWDGIIACDHAVEICGPSYVGKSTLAILLAVARANPTGKPIDLFGRMVAPAPAGKLIAIANEENGRQSAVAKIDSAIEMLGLPLRETWDRILLLSRAGLRAHALTSDDMRGVPKDDLWAALLHAAQHGAIDLVVLDTRARIFSGFGNPKDEDSQAAAAAAITRLVELTGAPVLVVSHTRKGASDDIEDVSGSAQRGGGADVILMVTAEREDGKVLSSKVVFIKLRDGVGEHPEPITFSTARGDDSRWRLAVNASARPGDQPAHERVRELLRAKGEQTKNEIRQSLRMSSENLERALSVLFAERSIGKRKKEVRGRERELFFPKVGAREIDRELRQLGIVKSANAKPEEVEDESIF
jgi:AAA domain-containing protein